MKTATPKKPATRKPPRGSGAARPAPAPEAPASAPEQIVGRGPILRLKDLIDAVATLSGEKRQSVRPVVEATLRVLGDALEAGESIVAPPFGKARVNRAKDTASGAMLTVKLKRSGAAKAPKSAEDEGLAEADE